MNKMLDSVQIALKNLNSTAKKLIIVHEDEVFTKKNKNILVLKSNFDFTDTLALIGEIKYVGIVNSDKFSQTSIDELINILTTKNKATVVRLNYYPVSCNVFYPTPEVGTKYVCGNYEYRYRQAFSANKTWRTILSQNGWGARVKDCTQTDYESPLAMIKGFPVTNLSYLFFCNKAHLLNLIDWDTSNVTNMDSMFCFCKATSVHGLSSFDTSSVTTMESMFGTNKITSLDLSNFDTSNVTKMYGMFHSSLMTNLNLSSFRTSRVTDMGSMFACCKAKNLDLKNFDTSKVVAMNQMFFDTRFDNLDLSNFDTSNVTDMSNMFNHCKITNLNLSSFTSQKVQKANSMFYISEIAHLDLSLFSPDSIKDTTKMFYSSDIEKLTTGTEEFANSFKAIFEFPQDILVLYS